jgi:septum formation protein
MTASLWLAAEPLLLASRSAARAAMLRAAGIPVEAVPAAVDERAEEAAARLAGASTAAVAERLALAKATAASRAFPGRLVLGADQTLALGEDALHKPAGRDEAFAQLRLLAGRTHHLQSAAALVRDGQPLGAALTTATLRVRPLSDPMIARYLAAAGEDVLGCVGVYQVEALGPHLFEAIEGDPFTIMGLPLLPLLGLLRGLDVLAG